MEILLRESQADTPWQIPRSAGGHRAPCCYRWKSLCWLLMMMVVVVVVAVDTVISVVVVGDGDDEREGGREEEISRL